MDVTVVGSCMTDMISYASRLPKPGETLHGDRFAIGFGGKGANQCVVAARLGAKTAMAARVGDDTFGHNYVQNFQKNNVNTDHVTITTGESTGAAAITVSADGQNSIIIVSGANLLLSNEDVTRAETVIMVSKILLCQLEVQMSTSIFALRLARKHGVKTILNPAPAQRALDPEMYQLADIFCPNETEAEILTGLPVKTVEDASAAINHLLDKGCTTVIITLGAQGVVYASQSDKNPVHVPAETVTPVDTTGAGDAFVGALAYFLSCHPDINLHDAVKKSCQVATISVQYAGTQTSFPQRDDLPSDFFT